MSLIIESESLESSHAPNKWSNPSEDEDSNSRDSVSFIINPLFELLSSLLRCLKYLSSVRLFNASPPITSIFYKDTKFGIDVVLKHCV